MGERARCSENESLSLEHEQVRMSLERDGEREGEKEQENDSVKRKRT